MIEDKSGGPVFPMKAILSGGLSKRELFAFGAMIGTVCGNIVKGNVVSSDELRLLSISCYQVADSMIEEGQR